MTQHKPSHLLFLREASSVDTSANRLQELYQTDPSLGSVIASNPSASIRLLDQLALQHPAEVLANPLLPLRPLEDGGAYRPFSLPALVSLCMAWTPGRDAELLQETKTRMAFGLDELANQEEASLSCEWVYWRSFKLDPEDCDCLIKHTLRLTMEVRSGMEARGAVSVDGIPNLSGCDPEFSDCSRGDLTAFLQALSSGNLHEYINDNELIRADGSCRDVRLDGEKLPDGFFISETALCKEGEEVLDFDYNLNGESLPVQFADGVVTVPLEFIDEENHDYQIAMGELVGLKSTALKTDCLPSDWPSRLAALLIP